MRIAISGTACQGKSTLVKDFLENWPNYSRSKESYRQVVKKDGLKINKEVNQDSQWKILNCLIDDLQNTTKEDNIIYDRCPLDNLVYSMWSYEKGNSDIDKAFIDKCIPLVRESMRLLDIIFFIPITKAAPVKIEAKENRETDLSYIKEIDFIFKAIERQHSVNGGFPFFVHDDKPAIIEIFGTPEERIKMIELYLDKDGEVVSDKESVLSNENLELMETLLGIQKQIDKKDKDEQKLRDKFLIKKHK